MSGPRVQVRTTSDEQHTELTAYAIVKGHKSLSDYMLYAAVTMMGKNPLTDTQKGKSERIIREHYKSSQLYS